MSVPSLKSIGTAVPELCNIFNFGDGVSPLPNSIAGHVTMLGRIDGIDYPNVSAKFEIDWFSRSLSCEIFSIFGGVFAPTSPTPGGSRMLHNNHEEAHTPLNTTWSGSTQVFVPNGISIGSAVFCTAQVCTVKQTDRQTDHATVTIRSSMIGFRMIHADDHWTLVLSASGPLTA